MADNTQPDSGTENPYAESAARLTQSQTATVKNNIYNAVTENPAQVSEYSKIANTLGVPLDSVRADPATARRRAAMQAFDADKVVTQYPHLAQFLENPINAAKSHNDLPTLAATEAAVKGLPQPSAANAPPDFSGSPNMKSGGEAPGPTLRDRLHDVWAGIFGGPTAAEARKEAAAAQATAILAARSSNADLVPDRGATPEQIQKLNDAAWEQSRQAIGGMSQIPQMAAEQFVKSASLGIAQPTVMTEPHSTEAGLAGGAGQLAGFIAGPAKIAGKALEMIPGAGALVATPGEAWASSLLREAIHQGGVLAGASALEQAGSAVLDSHSLGEAGKKLGSAALSGAGTGVLFGAAGRLLPDNTLAQWAGRFLGVSAAQDAMHGQNPLDDRPWQQKAFDYGMNAFFTVRGAGRTEGGWFKSDPSVLQGMKDAESAALAARGMQTLQGVADLAKQSELLKNDPGAFHDFIEKISDDGNAPKEVWVDAHKFADALNQSGISPDELQAKMPDVAGQLHEAMETNGDVKISLADYATNIAKAPVNDALMQHLKVDPEGMTFQEGQEHLAKEQTEMTDQAKGLAERKAAREERETQLDAIQNEITQNQVESGGRRPGEAKTNALLARAWYDTQSARMGMTPAELRAQHNPNFDNQWIEGGLSQRRKDVVDAATPERPASTLAEAKTHAAAFIGKPLTNTDTKIVGVVSNNNLGKMTSASAMKKSTSPEDHALAVANVDKLFTHAHLDESHPDSRGEKTIAGIHRFVAPMIGADGSVVAVKMTLKETTGPKEPNPIYSIETIDVEKPALLAPSGDGIELGIGVKDVATSQTGGLSDKVLRSVREVKDALEQDSRGNYDLATKTIGFNRDADLTTGPHELSHFFLDVFEQLARDPNAPADVKADMDALLRKFGIKGDTPEERLAEWSRMADDARAGGKIEDSLRDGHEHWADFIEQYLTKGEAPVPELQGLFSRFRSWFLNAYQRLMGADVKIDPELKQIADRMFASQEAITEAEKVRAYGAADITENSPLVDQYKALGKEATEAAIANMQARSLRDLKWVTNALNAVRRGLQREATEERKKIREDVTREVMAEPVNQARTWLTKGEMPDGEGNQVKAEKGFRLSTGDLESMFPKGELGRPDLDGLKGMTAKDGLHPDLVAEMFGFNSGRELINALLTGEKPADKIAGITDQRMLEQHGELTDPISIERAAEAAIHNEVRAKMMATGLKIFTKSPMGVNEINKAAKAAADAAIAGQKIDDLRPARYSAAETRANKDVLKLAPKDPAEAAAAQRAALLNNRLFKSATDAVAEIQKGLAYLKRFDKASIRGKIELDVRDQIDALLERFDLRANPSDEPTRPQLNLEKWIESQAAAGYSPSVTPEMLMPEFRLPYREMTVEQFRGLIDTVKSMEHVGRERNMITINGERQDLKDFVNNELVPKLEERGEKFSTEQLYDTPEQRGVGPIRNALEHLGSWLRALNAQLKPQEYKRNDFDRHEILGPFGRALFDPIVDANYNKVRWLRGLSDDFRAAAEKLGRAWQESLTEMVTNTKLIDDIATKATGQTVYMKMTRGRMLGLAIHVGNESNFDKLTKGYNWDPVKVWEFLSENMTAKDAEAVKTIWSLYEKHWPDMQAMYRRLGQTTPDKIEPRPFTLALKDGTSIEMPGGYAAIKYDPLRSRRGEKDAANQAINPGEGLFGRDYFSRSTTTNGSMNKRVDGYTDAIDLNFHTIERSLQESIHDLAYREALISANKIIEQPDFRKAFFRTYGREEYGALQDWIGRIANADNSDRAVGAMGRFLQYTRTGMVMTAIALRATTVLKHGGSAGIKSVAYLTGGGNKYFASRLMLMGSDYTNQIALAREKFGEINARLMQQDRDFRATASSLFEPESLKSQGERFGHSFVAWADMMTSVPTAWAAYDRAINEGIPKRQGGTGKPMTEEEAVHYANKVVREAHGSNVEAARSNIMTAPTEGLKMLTTLYGFMNNSYGQLADSINKFQTPGIGKPEILARTMAAIIVPAFWAHWLNEGTPHHDESWVTWAAKAIGGEVAGMVPVVRDAWSMAQGFSHAGVVGAESWMSSMVNAGRDVVHIAQGKEPNAPIQHVADAVGMGLHIPGLGQIGKSVQYASDAARGKGQHPANAAEYAKGLLIGNHKQ